MNCPKPDQLQLLSMELLDSAEVEAVRGHLRACEKCRAAAEQFKRQGDSIAKAHEAFHRNHDLHREQLMARLSVDPVALADSRPKLRSGGFLMRLNNSYGRGAAGLLAAAACVALVFTVFSSGEGKAFARMIERLRAAQTIKCRVHMTMDAAVMRPSGDGDRMRADTIQMVQTEDLYISDQFGVRRDTYEDGVHVSTTFHTPDQAIVYLQHARKQWHVENPKAMDPQVLKHLHAVLDDRVIPDLHLGLSSDPTYLIQALQELTAEADVVLGWQEFDGIDVYGFELSGTQAGFGPPLFDDSPDNKVRLWVDPESDLPARIELHFVSKIAPIERTNISARFAVEAVYDMFEIDPLVTADLFDATIPDDYQPIPELAGLVPELSEEAMIESLHMFSDLTGRYPASLNTMNVAHEVSFLIGSMQGERASAEHRKADTSKLPSLDKVGPKLQGFMYFTKLEADGATPEYFGATVKPGDAENVLVQWALPDGTTRVIYGDLSVETVP